MVHRLCTWLLPRIISVEQATAVCWIRTSNGIQNRNRRMPNGTYGGVRGRKTKVGRKLLRFPPTRLYSRLLSLLSPSVSVVVPIRFQYCRPRSLPHARMLPACVSLRPSFSVILRREGSSSASSGRPNPFCRLRHAPNIQTLINLLINNSYMSEKNSNFAFGNIQKQ